MRYIVRIDLVFDEYMPIILTILLLGSLARAKWIFSMVCFFGYSFFSLLFNYADVIYKIKNGPESDSKLAKANYLVSGFFVIALFISYWINMEFHVGS